MKRIVFTIILGLFFMESCIDKEENCDHITEDTYEFVMHFTISPAQEIYHIGDTITISSFVNNPIYERKTGNSYTLDNFKFYLVSYLYYMDTLIIDYSDFNRFEILLDSTYNQSIFTYSNDNSSILGQYNYHNNQYSYKFKLIAKEKGRYLFTQGSDMDFYGKDQYFEGKCKNDVDARFYMNDRGDNNSHLLDEATNNHYSGYLAKDKIGSQYLDFGGYCFQVVD
jgi:hypothetical protein